MTADTTPDGNSSTDPADTAATENAGLDGRRSTRGPSEHVIDIDSLHANVVHYQNEPDRCTISPVDVSDGQRLTTWLSVDTGVVRPLESMR